MKNFTRWVLLASIAVAVSAVVFNFGPVASSQSSRKGERSKVNPTPSSSRPRLENYDIRMRRAEEAEEESAAPKQKGTITLALDEKKPVLASQRQREAAAVIRQSMSAAQAQLAARVPNLKVAYNEALPVPEIVQVDGPGVLLSGVKDSEESTLRRFVSENAAVYGLTRAQAGQLTTFSDYTNPSGNLSFVELEQEINGLPVFQGYVRGVFTSDGRLVRTINLMAPGLRAADLSTTPELDPAEAVAAGIKSINLKVASNSLTVLDASANGKSHIVSAGPLSEETKTQLMYFAMVPGHAVLAYAMTLWEPDNAYYVFVDANTGQLLWRKNITQDQQTPYTYNVYDNDSPTPSAPVRSSLTSPTNTTSTEPQPPGISRTDLTRISESQYDNLGWIPDTAGPNAPTTGNNVDAGLDRVAPNGIDPGGRAVSTNYVFKFDYRPDGATDPVGPTDPLNAQFQMGAVTNLFFWSNRYHDQVYHLGFTEAARNFQTNNFGRGGLGGDAVRAEAQDSGGTNNANFNTPADGQQPRMQMYLWTGTPVRDGDLDQEVVYHELTHGTSNRLHANGSGLISNRSAGMGEGWSDFYAISLLSTLTPDGDDGKRLYAMGAYDTRNYYRAIRRFPYAVKSAVAANGRSHNPLTLADIDPLQINVSDAAFPVNPGQADQVHNQGEVWCSSLIEVRAKMIEKYGLFDGNQRTLQMVTDGMKLDPVDPTQLNGRDSILAANCAGFAGGDELEIWEAFRIRGAGFRANIAGLRVTESFEKVNLRLETVTAVEAPTGNNGNGVIDPGETVRLTIPLTNILCAHNAENTTAQINPGGGIANYGTVEPGTTDTQTIDLTLPATTACGAAIPITIQVISSLGQIEYSYFLNVGQPSALAPFENFDNVVAPALPPGWSTERTGAGMPWMTSTVNSDTQPNNAFTPNPTNPGTSELTSPPFAVNTGLARMSFRNLYNLEDGFDGMTLQIKIGNAPFRDIIAAGGSFVSGGYNGETNDGAAWTGLSAGTVTNPTYITTVVNLPPTANGQNVQLRWRVTGDPNTVAPGQSGARIDTIQLSTTADNCTPFGVTTYSISGRVTDANGNGIGGIQVTLSGTTNATRTTAADGSYSFANLAAGGNYNVGPTSPNYDYTPPFRSYNNLNSNVNDANFTARVAASISGRVTTSNGAQGIDGITITLTGTESRQTVTSGGGFYSFPNLTRGGTYTVTPSGGQNNTYTPPSRTYTNLQGPVTDANFTARENLVSPSPTPTPRLAQRGEVLITEFRQSVGNVNSSDEYIELYNNTEAALSINGYAIAIGGSAFGSDVFLTLPANLVIPRRGHLLIANTAAGGYSLTPYAQANITHSNANLMVDNQGFGLIDNTRTVMIDSVGFRGNAGTLPYIEGNGLTPTSGNRPNVQHAYVRKVSTLNTYPQDTGDNANDFVLVSVTAAVFPATTANGGPIQSILGAPGPENTASPVERSAFATPELIDPTQPADGGENRKRLACGSPDTPPCDPNKSAFGFLSLRRKITNNSGVSMTRLRFRIIDITTLGSPGGGTGSGQADLRALSSTDITVTINGTPTPVRGTTLEQPTTTPPMDGGLGGGLNNSLSVGSVALATPLANGQTINVQFLLGVQREGAFRFAVNVEALP